MIIQLSEVSFRLSPLLVLTFVGAPTLYVNRVKLFREFNFEISQLTVDGLLGLCYLRLLGSSLSLHFLRVVRLKL